VFHQERSITKAMILAVMIMETI